MIASIAARIQDILKGRSKPSRPGARAQPGVEADEDAAFAARCAADEASAAVHEVLGGELVEGPAGPCLVVERGTPASHVHGRHGTERYASAAAGALGALPWFIKGDAGIPLPRSRTGRAGRPAARVTLRACCSSTSRPPA